MLILTRKKREVIKIWDNISISVISINVNQVRIGIDAPKEICVNRYEVCESIKTSKNDFERDCL
jgi:carbon storage regulator